MRLVSFEVDGRRGPGALTTAGIADLSALVPSIEEALDGGRALLRQLSERLPECPTLGADAARLLAPLKPASLRDFLAFEEHARRGAARRGEPLAQAWYEIPIYYKGNHRQITGPDEIVAWPSFTERLDFELEIAAVICARARDLGEPAAAEAIAGYTIMNDWSARDLQRQEMAARLGPAKSKDFATSLGPSIVTWDEADPLDGLRMEARVNGESWFRGTTRDMHWSFPQMIAYVSRDEEIWPGDVYGSGTSFGGCGLDLDRWIHPGDVVELEVEALGVLRNRIGAPK
jgi:2-keto-4-pentenoate hydratase/2-oxohepta-3-ene-1,7-dioic acid hydratase in catechol pathway